jgi:hypothetical protein
MNVSLGVQWEQFVNEKVESGRYLTASEVLRDGQVVGRWIVKDPAALRGSIGSGAVPAPEFTPARDPNAPDTTTPGGKPAPATSPRAAPALTPAPSPAPGPHFLHSVHATG